MPKTPRPRASHATPHPMPPAEDLAMRDARARHLTRYLASIDTPLGTVRAQLRPGEEIVLTVDGYQPIVLRGRQYALEARLRWCAPGQYVWDPADPWLYTGGSRVSGKPATAATQARAREALEPALAAWVAAEASVLRHAERLALARRRDDLQRRRDDAQRELALTAQALTEADARLAALDAAERRAESRAESRAAR